MITRRVIKNGDKTILLEAINATTVNLVTNNAMIIEKRSNGRDIIELSIGEPKDFYLCSNNNFNEIIFDIGDGRNISYKITQITAVDSMKYRLKTHSRTTCSFFLPPMLGYDRKWFSWDKYFINAYLVKDFHNDDPKIGLAYRFIPEQAFLSFEKKLMCRKEYLYTYDLDYETELNVFTTGSIRNNTNLQRIVDGQYSMISPVLKEGILRFHNQTKDDVLGGILYKTENRRKQLELNLGSPIDKELELFSLIDLDKELITITK